MMHCLCTLLVHCWIPEGSGITSFMLNLSPVPLSVNIAFARGNERMTLTFLLAHQNLKIKIS